MKNDAEPWLSPEEFADLQSAAQAYRSEGPRDEQLSRMLAGIQSGAAPASVAAGAVKLKLAALLLGGLGVVGTVFWTSVSSRDQPSAGPSSSAPEAPLLTQPSVVGAEHESIPEPPPDVIPAPIRQRKPVRWVARHSVEARVATPQPETRSDPAAELALLSRARRVLHSDPARTIALTDQHLHDFPRGAFCEERELLAMEALLNVGQARTTLERARHFQQTFAGSVHLSQVNALRAQAQQKLSDSAAPSQAEAK